jgi:hypothetical protein
MTRHEFDAIIFDMDGVITKTATLHAWAWRRTFDEFLARHETPGGEPHPPFDIDADYLKYVDGKPRHEGVRSFLAARGIELAEGEPIDPGSIVVLSLQNGNPVFPSMQANTIDAFLRRIHACGKKWIVLVDPENAPKMVLDSDEFIRDALFNHERFNPYRHCHRLVVVTNGRATMGDVIARLKVKPEHPQDDVVDHDVILLWNETLRVIIGGDILGRLLRGMVQNPAVDHGIAGDPQEPRLERG